MFLGSLALVGGYIINKHTVAAWAKTNIVGDRPVAGRQGSRPRREYLVDLQFEVEGVPYSVLVTTWTKPDAKILVRYPLRRPEAATIDSSGLFVAGILGLATGACALLFWCFMKKSEE